MRELRYLTAFIVLAEERHFGRAAGRLGVSQPSLSEQIARLEDALGVQLVVRQMRPVGLTPAGEDLADAVSGPLDQIGQAVARLRVGDPDRVLRLALPRAQFRLHPPVRAMIDGVRAQLPGWEVAVSELLGSQATDALHEGLVDLAVAYSPVYGVGLHAEPLFMDQPMVLMRADHPLASAAEVHAPQLRDAVMLIWNQEATRGLMDAFFSVCDRHGFRPMVKEVATTPGALATELDRGAGVAIVAQAWANNAILGKNLVSLPLRQPTLALAGVVVWSEAGRPTVVSAIRSWLSRK